MIGLGARIAAARKNAALSQATLGRRLGVGQTAVSYWEADKREPCLADLVALARELGVTLADLAGDDTTPGDAYWVGWRAGWLACAGSVQVAATLRPNLMPARAGRCETGVFTFGLRDLRAARAGRCETGVFTFGLRDLRAAPLGAGQPWVTARGRDLAEVWPELINGRSMIAVGGEVVRRDSPTEPWRVVGTVGEGGVLVESPAGGDVS